MSASSETDDSIPRLEGSLGHAFADRGLLRDALTHRSFANEKPNRAPKDNERLEYLGDSLVGVVVASILYERFPDADEGELTRRRAELVREASLAAIARELSLGDALRLGKGEERQGGRDKPRLLASAFEACVGALLCDAGPERAFALTRSLFEPRLSSFGAGDRDFKSRVQEILQAKGSTAPTYELVDTEGPDHERIFVIAIAIDGSRVATARGRSKNEAEQQAAATALQILGEGVA